MIGKFAVYISLVLSILSTLFYFISIKNSKRIKLAEYLYFGLCGVLVFASAYLLSNILSYNFQFTYIWEYSSRELPLGLLITSFFSGQEGSFLLWALMLGILGLVLQPYAKKHGYQGIVMGFYSLIMVFIVTMLVAKSPFTYIWESFAGEGVEIGFMPPNGRGLNPILQNYWNAIHPPILFIGYAAMTVPFVFAVAGLIRKDFKSWIDISIPWTLAATGVLGLGIMLGGFWAYETLGWGGFWGWDPVENASLLPWLVAVALVHTMLVQKRTGGLVRTNFVLAVLSFLLVIYATFLTRSGVLGDISVHSFGEPGKFVYTLLIGFMATFFVIGVATLIIRMKAISQIAAKLDFKMSSREFFLSIGSIVILAISVIVFLGTNWPIFSELFSSQKSSVDISFYDKWNMPFAILILLLNALSLYLHWNRTDIKSQINKIAISFSLAVAMALVAFLNGVNIVGYLLLAFASFYTIFVNAEFIIRTWKTYKRGFGAYISHIGVGFLLLGALLSGAYSSSEHLSMELGTTKEALGYKITFKEVNQIEKHFKDREKYEYVITAEKDGKIATLKPVFYWSDFNDRHEPFLEPGIHEQFMSDLYVSPKASQSGLNYPTVLLVKEESTKVPIDTSITMTMLGFDMQHGMSLSEDRKVKLGVAVEFTLPNKEKRVDTLYSAIDIDSKQGSPIPVLIPGTHVKVGFTELISGMQQGASQAAFIFLKDGEPEPEPTEIFAFDFAIKPFINFVWLGTIFIVVGFFWSIARHSKKKKEE